MEGVDELSDTCYDENTYKRDGTGKRRINREKNRKIPKADVILKEFWRQNERFADLFNAVLFQGKGIIKAEELIEMDTDVSGIVELQGEEKSLIKMRDVVKKSAYGAEFVLLGVENQQKIHYGMPLRTMLYDGMGYLKEYNEISRMRKGENWGNADEFLSKFRKTDRLHPVFTVTIYYGEREWDGPVSLKDMMKEIPEGLSGFFADYRMNLIQICESDRFTFHNQDVQDVFQITREIYRRNFRAIEEKYQGRNIKSELVRTIGAITESSYLLEGNAEKEELNMCKALEELEARGREEGREEGRQQGIEKSIETLLKKFSAEETAEMLELPLEEVLFVQDKRLEREKDQ